MTPPLRKFAPPPYTPPFLGGPPIMADDAPAPTLGPPPSPMPSVAATPEPDAPAPPPPYGGSTAPEQSPAQYASDASTMRGIKPIGAPPSMTQRLLGSQPPPSFQPQNAENGAMQIPQAPTPRTPGFLQRLGAAAMGAGIGYVNAAGRSHIDPQTAQRAEQGILHPGEASQQAAYQRTVQQMQAQGQAHSQAAQTQHAQAQAGLATQQAATLAEEGKRASKADYITIPGGGLFNTKTGEWVKQPVDKTQLTELNKDQAESIGIKATPDGHYYIPNSAVGQYIGSQKDKSIKTAEEALIGVINDDTMPPDQKKAKSDELIKAHNLLHPQTPIHGIESDAQGNATLVVANPADPTNVQKIPLGKIGKPQQVPASIQLGNMLTGNQDAITLAATQYRQTRTMPPVGRNPLMAVAILKKAAELDKADGISPEQSGVNAELFKAHKKALDQQTVAFNQVQSFEKTASKNMDLADSVSQVVDRTGSPLANKYLLYLKGSVAGDADTTKLHNAVTTAASEYAKVISGAMGNAAVTDSTRKEAEAMLNAALSKGTFTAVVAQMKQEMANRNAGFSETLKQLQADMGGGAQAPPTQQPTAQPTAKIYTQADVDAAVAAHPGTTAQQIEAGFKAKNWVKR